MIGSDYDETGSEADMETRTDPIWWVIRFGSIGVALFGFLYKVTCETFMCAAVHDSWHYRPFTWLGVVGVLIALPAWATAVKSYR